MAEREGDSPVLGDGMIYFDKIHDCKVHSCPWREDKDNLAFRFEYIPVQGGRLS